jgi:CHAT domain-containing protein
LVEKQHTEPGFQFRTIQIYTNNPSFPWELVVPVRNGKPFDGFLGSAFQIARWHIDDHVSNLGPLSLHVMSVKAIAPRYTGGAALPYLGQEMAAIQSMPGYQSVPGTMADLRTLLQFPPEGIVHFAGHGDAVAAADGSMNYDIRMEDGSFDPTRMRGLAGLSANHPVYFMNACQTGQETVEAGLIDGWAGAVLESGASGFIGGLWPLPDRGAAAFSAVFYKELLGELAAGKAVSISELLMHSRQELLRTGDPTALAYVFYGDTRFRLLSAR